MTVEQHEDYGIGFGDETGDVPAPKKSERREGVEYLPDVEETARRIAELWDSLEYARYELNAGVALARAHGLKWTDLAPHVGVTRQALSLRFKGAVAPSAGDPERERIGRLIGIGRRIPRYVVRRVVSGRVGVTAVVWEELSRHIKLEAAVRAFDKWSDEYERCELVKVLPDGTIRPVKL